MLKRELELLLKDKQIEIESLRNRLKYLEEHIVLRDEKDKIVSENYKKYSDKWSNDILRITKENFNLKKQVLDDMNKFNELHVFISTRFPDTILSNDKIPKQQLPDSELSDTLIGEGGKVYTPKHVINLAIMLIESLLKTIDDITGKSSDIGDI